MVVVRGKKKLKKKFRLILGKVRIQRDIRLVLTLGNVMDMVVTTA